MLEVMGGMIHIKYFCKIPHLDTSLALFHHLTASKSFRKNAIQPRIHSSAPKIQFESSPSQCSFFRNVHIIHSIYYGADQVTVEHRHSCSCSAEFIWRSLWCPHEVFTVHWHKAHAILGNPPQQRTGLLWWLGNIPVKFSHSSMGEFALLECFKADPEPWFQPLPLPTRGEACACLCAHSMYVLDLLIQDTHTQCLYTHYFPWEKKIIMRNQKV